MAARRPSERRPRKGRGVAPIRTMKLECDCGFLVGSHDGGEVLELSIMHVRQKHGQTFSKDDVRKK